MSYVITFDRNSNCLMVFLGDGSKVDGSGKTGLTYETSGLIIATRADNEAAVTAYKQADGNIESISTLGTFAAPSSGKCRFKEVDATNMPGVYEIQLADARLSVASARDLVIMVSGGGVVPTPMHVPLLAYDLYSAAPTVTLTEASIDAILDEAMSGHTTAGSLAKLISDINTAIGLIKAKTDPWPSIVYP